MTDDPFRQMFHRSVAALALGSVLVSVCYQFVDRPVATFVHDHGFNRDIALKWFTYPPPLVQLWTPAILCALILRRWFGPFARWQTTLLVACVCIVVADQFRESLSLVFGRTWPETWIDDNPSYIQDGVYGFHFFHGGQAYESFPSGHTARTVAAVTPFWIGYPPLRWLCIAATGLVVVGLIGMNYHFVSDVIAGGTIGGLVGAYGMFLMGRDSR